VRKFKQSQGEEVLEPTSGCPFDPLTRAEACLALGLDLDLTWEDQAEPCFPDDVTARAREAIGAVMAQHAPGNVVIVTHGDILNRYLPELPGVPGVGVYAPKECGFAVVKAPHGEIANEEAIVEKHRLDSLM